MDRSSFAAIRKRLLTWYDRHRRDLSWRRRAGDPYAQWVAEVMLQQTRVLTIERRYDDFLQRFPTVAVLAEATEAAVLKAWEGLGYYRRALLLHRAARELHRAGNGMPTTATGLRELPGVGEYISAAVASIAFNEPVAAVDGNVARVIARLFAIRDDVLSQRGAKRLRTLAQELLSRRRPGDFNQAWMDLGSRVCLPASPRCCECPLRAYCTAAHEGLQAQLPVRRKAAAVPRVEQVVGVFTRRGRILVQHRPPGGLWSGLWEFPNTRHYDTDTRACVGPPALSQLTVVRHVGALHELAIELGFELGAAPQYVGDVTHRLTHRLLQFYVYWCPAERPKIGRVRRNSNGAPKRKWLYAKSVRALAMSVAHQRILQAALASKKG